MTTSIKIHTCTLCKEECVEDYRLDVIQINNGTYVQLCDNCIGCIKTHCGFVGKHTFDIERDRMNEKINELARTVAVQHMNVEAIIGGSYSDPGLGTK